MFCLATTQAPSFPVPVAHVPFCVLPAAVGRVYEKLVRIRNVTAVSRGLRLLPPASQYFHASLPRFPASEGLLAPGMAAEVTLRFCPDSLGDYEDALGVDTAGTRISVRVRAQRPPPSLTLPEVRQAGWGNWRVGDGLSRSRGVAASHGIVHPATTGYLKACWHLKRGA